MGKEISLITDTEELILWESIYSQRGIIQDEKEAMILLDYLEGHDYAIATDKSGNLYVKDIADDKEKLEPTTIDDVVEKMCNWNMELLYYEKEKTDNEEIMDESSFNKLCDDEEILDKMFERTDIWKRAVEWITPLAEGLAEAIIAKQEMGEDTDKIIDESVSVIADGIKERSR